MSKKVIQISSSIASGIGVIISVILTTISIKNGYNTVRINGLDKTNWSTNLHNHKRRRETSRKRELFFNCTYWDNLLYYFNWDNTIS